MFLNFFGSKRTPASVTNVDCSCGYLKNAADDPDSPIQFDQVTAEFHFVYADSMLVIYHCPFCGGVAPKSKRASLFAQISRAEVDRLTEHTTGIFTLSAAEERLGAPDWDSFEELRTGGNLEKPPTIQRYRSITYKKLSEVADVTFYERGNGRAYMTLQGKFIGASAG